MRTSCLLALGVAVAGLAVAAVASAAPGDPDPAFGSLLGSWEYGLASGMLGP